jgi:hypothetical protein
LKLKYVLKPIPSQLYGRKSSDTDHRSKEGALETQDFCEVGNLVKKKLVRLKTARLELGLIHDSACGPE